MAEGWDTAQLWLRLLDAVTPVLVSGSRYCAARSIHGSTYRAGGIVVIGRAPNGWAFDFTKEDLESQNERSALADQIINAHVCSADPKMIGGRAECGPMHWVRHPYFYRGATRVNASFGKFWPMIAGLMQSVSEPSAHECWEETIAWANLYPFSCASGNPNSKLATAQRQHAANLLASDLQARNPGAAIFITEINSPDKRSLEWSEPFHDALGVTDIERMAEGPIVAISRLSGKETRAIFVVRPDARHGVAYDFVGELAKVLRERS